MERDLECALSPPDHITRTGHYTPLAKLLFCNRNANLVTIGLLACNYTYITSFTQFTSRQIVRQGHSEKTLSNLLKLELSSPGEDICPALVDW